MQLGRGKEEESIEEARDFVSKSGICSIEDVKKKVNEIRTYKLYLRSFILRRISIELEISRNRPPNEALEWFRDRVYEIQCASTEMKESGGRTRDIAIKYGLELAIKLLKEIRKVKDAQADLRAVNEARCLLDISNICDEEKVLDYAQEGIEIMERQYGKNAQQYKYYIGLEIIIGKYYAATFQFRKAEKIFVKCLNLIEEASDFDDENQKQDLLNETSRCLEYARLMLTIVETSNAPEQVVGSLVQEKFGNFR